MAQLDPRLILQNAQLPDIASQTVAAQAAINPLAGAIELTNTYLGRKEQQRQEAREDALTQQKLGMQQQQIDIQAASEGRAQQLLDAKLAQQEAIAQREKVTELLKQTAPYAKDVVVPLISNPTPQNIAKLRSKTEARRDVLKDQGRDYSNTQGLLDALDTAERTGDFSRIQEEANFVVQAATYNGVFDRDLQGGVGRDSRTAAQKNMDYYQSLKAQDPEAAKQFGMSTGLVSKEGRELSAHLQKRLSMANDEAVKSESNARSFELLSDQIAESDLGAGFFGSTFPEMVKEFTGLENGYSELRRRAQAVRVSQAAANLPPGPATDSDVKLALSGFPGESANKKTLSKWLRGTAKLEENAAIFNQFKAEYISEKGSERGFLKAWKDSDMYKVASERPYEGEDYKRTPTPGGRSGRSRIKPKGSLNQAEVFQGL